MTQLDTFRRLDFVILLTLHSSFSRSAKDTAFVDRLGQVLQKAAAPELGGSTKCCLTREKQITKTILKTQKHLEKAHRRGV